MFSIPPVAAVVLPAAAFSVSQSKDAPFQEIWSPAKEKIQQLAGHPAVQREFEAFLATLESAYNQGSISNEGMKKIEEALEMAAFEHRDQKRTSIINPNPPQYIFHPIQVAHNLLSVGEIYDADILAAALLHDTVEDCDTSPEEIERKFGPAVREMVEALSDQKGLSRDEQLKAQLEHAAHFSFGSALIKLSDKTCVLYELHDQILEGDIWYPLEKSKAYFEHADKLVSVLKERDILLPSALFDRFDAIQAAGKTTFGTVKSVL